MEKTPDIKTLLDKVIEFIGEKLSLIFLFIVAITFFEVFVRYVLNAPTIWVHETAMFLGGTLFVFGGAYALATDKHVRVVLIYDNVSQKTRHLLNIFHHIMGLIFSAMMTWAGFQMGKEAWLSPWGEIHLESSGTAWDTHFPAYLKAIIFITMMIISIQFILKLVAEVKELLSIKQGAKNV